MEDKKILKAAVKARNAKQTDIAKRMGIGTSALSMNMSRDNMSLDKFLRILNALDYDVAVVDRTSGEIAWTVGEE